MAGGAERRWMPMVSSYWIQLTGEFLYRISGFSCFDGFLDSPPPLLTLLWFSRFPLREELADSLEQPNPDTLGFLRPSMATGLHRRRRRRHRPKPVRAPPDRVCPAVAYTDRGAEDREALVRLHQIEVAVDPEDNHL